MKKYIFRDGAVQYVRITKQAAQKALEAGETIALCPVNLRPGFPWAPHMALDKARLQAENSTLDQYISQFEYYNCSDKETGLYTAFYRIKDNQRRG